MNEEERKQLISEMKEVFATKDDLKNFATKDDLKNVATKDDIASLRKDIESIHTDLIAHDEKLEKIIEQLDALPSKEDMAAHRTEHATIKNILREQLNAEI